MNKHLIKALEGIRQDYELTGTERVALAWAIGKLMKEEGEVSEHIKARSSLGTYQTTPAGLCKEGRAT